MVFIKASQYPGTIIKIKPKVQIIGITPITKVIAVPTADNAPIIQSIKNKIDQLKRIFPNLIKKLWKSFHPEDLNDFFLVFSTVFCIFFIISLL